MATKARKGVPAQAKTSTGARYEELKQMLIERQREILNDVQCKIRTVRAEGSEKDREVLKQGAEVDIQEDIELALIQMKGETLKRINEALVRLKDGTYGYCLECGEEIAHPRLCAIPFAVRCKDCEEIREVAYQRERSQARWGVTSVASARGFV